MEGKHFLNNINHFFGKEHFDLINSNLKTFYRFEQTKNITIHNDIKDKTEINNKIVKNLITEMIIRMKEKEGGGQTVEELKNKIRNKVFMISPKTV